MLKLYCQCMKHLEHHDCNRNCSCGPFDQKLMTREEKLRYMKVSCSLCGFEINRDDSLIAERKNRHEEKHKRKTGVSKNNIKGEVKWL